MKNAGNGNLPANRLDDIGTVSTIRQSVRVVMLDEQNCVLLFRTVNPETGASFWCPPGGGIESDETAETAAKREIREETGLTELLLTAEIWHRRHEFSWRDESIDQREQWFLANVAHFEPTRDGHTENELLDLQECRWWSVSQIRESTEVFVPRDLGRLLGNLIEFGPPDQPFEVGV